MMRKTPEKIDNSKSYGIILIDTAGTYTVAPVPVRSQSKGEMRVILPDVYYPSSPRSSQDSSPGCSQADDSPEPLDAMDMEIDDDRIPDHYEIKLWRNDMVINRQPRFLMVRRKFTYGFLSFVGGDYDITDLRQISALLSDMTDVERGLIVREDIFSLTLWIWRGYKKLDHTTVVRLSRKTAVSHNKKVELENTYHDVEDGTGQVIKMSLLDYLLANTIPKQNEPPWEFPKGRYHPDDDGNVMNSALREFSEETKFSPDLFDIENDVRPYIEKFQGMNKHNYVYSYHIASLKDVGQVTLGDMPYEISDIRFFSLAEFKNKDVNAVNKKRKIEIMKLIIKKLTELGKN